MYLHANAKLGLAGRLALVRAVEDGLSLQAAAVASASRRRRCIVGGIAGWMAAVVVRRCWIARAGRIARRGCLRSSCRSGSATAAARPVGVLARLPARPALPTRPSGRCSSGPDSRTARERPRSQPTGTSGRVLEICCTWTSARNARFLRPGHRVTGDRSQASRRMRPETRVGYDYAHAIVHDHSRLA
jgi:hypothetical protein